MTRIMDMCDDLKGQRSGQLTDKCHKCRDGQSAVSSEWEGLQSSFLVQGWSMKTRIDMRDDLKLKALGG